MPYIYQAIRQILYLTAVKCGPVKHCVQVFSMTTLTAMIKAKRFKKRLIS